MGRSLQDQIHQLQEFYWSDADPDGRGFVALADVLRRQGDLVEAGRLLREGLERHPTLASGHVVAGWAFAARGKAEEAEEAFRRALRLDPGNLEATDGLATLLEERGDERGAMELLRRLAHLDPRRPGLRERIAGLEAAAGTDGEAEALEGESGLGGRVESEDIFPPPWRDAHAVVTELNWGDATLQRDASEPTGEDDEEEWIEEEDVPAPASADRTGTLITRTLGEIYARQGLMEQAEDVFEVLLERSPDDEDLKRRLEEIRAGGGEDVSQETEGGPWGGGEDHPGGTGLEEEMEEDELFDETAGPEDLPPGPGVVPRGELTADRYSVPVQDLAPDSGVVPVEDLAPEKKGMALVPVQDLAPEPQVVPIGELAPEPRVVPIQELAPDPAVVSVDSLAPEEEGVAGVPGASPGPVGEGVVAVRVEAPAPDERAVTVVPVHDLAPDPQVVPIHDLAPDEGPEDAETTRKRRGGDDPTLNAFQDWLDNLQ